VLHQPGEVDAGILDVGLDCAGYLAQVFPHVFVDVGLATHNVGLRAGAVIAETLELTPFGKFLFSTDAFGLAELYHLGTLLFRKGLSDFLRAGNEFGANTLSRFYAIHMLLLPGAIMALIGAHIYLVTKLGTTAPPWVKPDADDPVLEAERKGRPAKDKDHEDQDEGN